MIKTLLKKLGLAILIVVVLAQFFGPDKNDGDVVSIEPFLADTNPPEDVKLILKNACFDCHSDHTRYPWYNDITPINYWLADHVRHGKGDFNVSKWTEYSDKKKDHKLEELTEEVEKKHMPLPSYMRPRNALGCPMKVFFDRRRSARDATETPLGLQLSTANGPPCARVSSVICHPTTSTVKTDLGFRFRR